MSPTAIRFVEGVLHQEIRRGTNAQQDLILSTFRNGFADLCIRALKHAGFQILCPLIMDPRPDFATGICTIWDTDTPITALRRGIVSYTPLERKKVAYLEYEGTRAAIARRSWAYIQSLTTYLSLSQTWNQKILKTIRDRDEALQQNQTEALKNVERQYILLFRSVFGNAYTKNFLREIVHWHYNKLRDEYGLTNDTFTWAYDLISSLFYVRSVVGDEGMGVYSSKNERNEIVHLTSIRSEPETRGQRANEISGFPSLNALFSKPTPTELYSRTNVVRGRATRKTQVRKAGLVLSDAGLVFKLRRNMIQKRKRSSSSSDPYTYIKEYRGVLATDIYHDINYRESNVDVACKMHSQWRLCPTEIILSVFNDFIVELMETEEYRQV